MHDDADTQRLVPSVVSYCMHSQPQVTVTVSAVLRGIRKQH